MSLAGISAVTSCADTNVVVKIAEFQYTAEFPANPVPVTVNMNVSPPAVALVGASIAMVGVVAGFVPLFDP